MTIIIKIIFTPLDTGGGGENKESLTKKTTWNESFKWKPVEFDAIHETTVCESEGRRWRRRILKD